MNTLTTDLEAANETLTAAEETLSSAETALEGAENDLSSAEDSLSSAQSTLSSTPRTRSERRSRTVDDGDGGTKTEHYYVDVPNEPAYGNAQDAVDNAEAARDAAQEARDSAQEARDQAQEARDAAQEARDQLQEDLDAAIEIQNQLIVEVEAAQLVVTETQQTLNTEQNALNQLRMQENQVNQQVMQLSNEINGLQTSLNAAQQALTMAQNDQRAAQMEVNNAQTAVNSNSAAQSQASAELQAAEAALAQAEQEEENADDASILGDAADDASEMAQQEAAQRQLDEGEIRLAELQQQEENLQAQIDTTNSLIVSEAVLEGDHIEFTGTGADTDGDGNPDTFSNVEFDMEDEDLEDDLALTVMENGVQTVNEFAVQQNNLMVQTGERDRVATIVNTGSGTFVATTSAASTAGYVHADNLANEEARFDTEIEEGEINWLEEIDEGNITRAELPEIEAGTAALLWNEVSDQEAQALVSRLNIFHSDDPEAMALVAEMIANPHEYSYTEVYAALSRAKGQHQGTIVIGADGSNNMDTLLDPNGNPITSNLSIEGLNEQMWDGELDPNGQLIDARGTQVVIDEQFEIMDSFETNEGIVIYEYENPETGEILYITNAREIVQQGPSLDSESDEQIPLNSTVFEYAMDGDFVYRPNHGHAIYHDEYNADGSVFRNLQVEPSFITARNPEEVSENPLWTETIDMQDGNDPRVTVYESHPHMRGYADSNPNGQASVSFAVMYSSEFPYSDRLDHLPLGSTGFTEIDHTTDLDGNMYVERNGETVMIASGENILAGAVNEYEDDNGAVDIHNLNAEQAEGITFNLVEGDNWENINLNPDLIARRDELLAKQRAGENLSNDEIAELTALIQSSAMERDRRYGMMMTELIAIGGPEIAGAIQEGLINNTRNILGPEYYESMWNSTIDPAEGMASFLGQVSLTERMILVPPSTLGEADAARLEDLEAREGSLNATEQAELDRLRMQQFTSNQVGLLGEFRREELQRQGVIAILEADENQDLVNLIAYEHALPPEEIISILSVPDPNLLEPWARDIYNQFVNPSNLPQTEAEMANLSPTQLAAATSLSALHQFTMENHLAFEIAEADLMDKRNRVTGQYWLDHAMVNGFDDAFDSGLPIAQGAYELWASVFGGPRARDLRTYGGGELTADFGEYHQQILALDESLWNVHAARIDNFRATSPEERTQLLLQGANNQHQFNTDLTQAYTERGEAFQNLAENTEGYISAVQTTSFVLEGLAAAGATAAVVATGGALAPGVSPILFGALGGAIGGGGYRVLENIASGNENLLDGVPGGALRGGVAGAFSIGGAVAANSIRQGGGSLLSALGVQYGVGSALPEAAMAYIETGDLQTALVVGAFSSVFDMGFDGFTHAAGAMWRGANNLDFSNIGGEIDNGIAGARAAWANRQNYLDDMANFLFGPGGMMGPGGFQPAYAMATVNNGGFNVNRPTGMMDNISMMSTRPGGVQRSPEAIVRASVNNFAYDADGNVIDGAVLPRLADNKRARVDSQHQMIQTVMNDPAIQRAIANGELTPLDVYNNVFGYMDSISANMGESGSYRISTFDAGSKQGVENAYNIDADGNVVFVGRGNGNVTMVPTTKEILLFNTDTNEYMVVRTIDPGSTVSTREAYRNHIDPGTSSEVPFGNVPPHMMQFNANRPGQVLFTADYMNGRTLATATFNPVTNQWNFDYVPIDGLQR